MVLIKSKPESILSEGYFPQTINSMLNSFFEESKLKSQTFGFIPQADIIEHETSYEIRMSLPGIKKEDVKISHEGDLLNVEGERKSEITNEQSKFVRKEISYGKFSRTFNVGKLDTSAIEASFENGVLGIVIPKTKEAKASTIEIK